MKIQFRRLTIDDLDTALIMNRTFRDGLLTREGTTSFLNDPACWLWTGLLDGQIIAFAYGYSLPRPDSRKMLYIHEVGVSEPFQRQGIGTILMTTLQEECRRQGFHRIFLIADQKNTAANALYRKCGGEVSYDSGGNDTTYLFIL